MKYKGHSVALCNHIGDRVSHLSPGYAMKNGILMSYFVLSIKLEIDLPSV